MSGFRYAPTKFIIWANSYMIPLLAADWGRTPQALISRVEGEQFMETTSDPAAEQASASGARLKNNAIDSAGAVKSVAADEIKNLIADVEDLVARIADLKDADVARVRTRVIRAVDVAKESLTDSADTLRRQAQRAASGADDFVRESPWQAVGLAAVVGAVVGILVTRRS
jgi:ElaB/YqjD/DUF883 family membrane-anchored ribosome-binding protein